MSKYYVSSEALPEFVHLVFDAVKGKFDDVEEDQMDANFVMFNEQPEEGKLDWLTEAIDQVQLVLDAGHDTKMPREEIMVSADWIEASAKTMAVVREGLHVREEALRLREEAVMKREEAVHYRELDASLQETSVVKQLENMTEEGIEPDEIRRCANPECRKVLTGHTRAKFCTGAYGKCGKRYHYLKRKGEPV